MPAHKQEQSTPISVEALLMGHASIDVTSSVILFGSGISAWSPSRIPTGQRLSQALQEFLFAFDDRESWRQFPLQRFLSAIPFENMNDSCPPSVELWRFYAQLFAENRPNFFHAHFAEISNSGIVHALLTTNYDCCVEEKLSLNTQVNVFWNADSYVSQKVSLFKMHGSVSEPKSLVYNLTQETKLPFGKRDVLLDVLSGRHLIVVGYSGLDFEICPVLALANCSKITWLVRPGEAPSAGLRTLCRSVDVNIVEWDLRYGLPWKRTEEPLEFASLSTSCFVNSLTEFVADEVQHLHWSLRFANRIGHADYGAELLRRLEAKSPEVVAIERGFVAFQAGRYRQSAHSFSRLLRTTVCSPRERVLRRLHVFNSWRCFGAYFRAMFALAVAMRIACRDCPDDSELCARVRLHRILLLKMIFDLVRIAPILRWTFGSSLRAAIVVDLESIRNVLVGADIETNMYTLKQVEDLSAQLGGEPGDNDVYHQLGFLVGSSTATRRGALEPGVTDLRQAQIARYELVCALGCNSEAWKLALKIASIAGDSRALWLMKSKQKRALCEYSRLGGIIAGLRARFD